MMATSTFNELMLNLDRYWTIINENVVLGEDAPMIDRFSDDEQLILG